jgi:Protein of unknown function (DUF1445)
MTKVEAKMQKQLSGCAGNAMMQIEDPTEARRIIRAGDYAGHTAGVAAKYVQGNLCILPKELALEFAAFCQRNPKPCPIIGMGAPGDPTLPDLGDIDIRTDVPRYRVFKDGTLVDEPLEISKYWTPDLVTFVLGCSFSFELPILEAGIRLRHIEHNTTVPMYRSTIDCVPAGRFRGKMVVSMRPFTGDPDHIAFPGCARSTRAPRHSRSHWRARPDAARLRRPAGDCGGRIAAVLGLRGHSASGHRGRPPGALHHAQAGFDADHRQAQQCAGSDLRWSRSPARPTAAGGRRRCCRRPGPSLRFMR